MAKGEAAETPEKLNDLGHLSSGIGHHVINAFSAIVSNAEILRLTTGTGDAADPLQVVETIVKTAVEASAVARRLIDFTRPITAIGPDLIALDRLAEEVLDDGRASGRPGIEWIAQLQPVPPIRGQTVQLRAMFDHLIANSLEALPPRGGAITIATGLDGRGWVVMEVRDTGRGMGGEVQVRAVEPFFSTKPGHFGVGLSIANGIWRRHRGTLAIRSQPGAGTQVRLCVEPGDRLPIPPSGP